MARRDHYERAFEAYLRSRRTPYVSVDEAKQALTPSGLSIGGRAAIKSFDFVVSGETENLLIDVKGRKAPGGRAGSTARRPERWVTEDDVESLRIWQRLFGDGFRAGFVFMHWRPAQPPDALFEEVIEHDGRWYTLRRVLLDDYRQAMRIRSPRWRTVDVPSEAYDRISRPFRPPRAGGKRPSGAQASLLRTAPSVSLR